MYYFCVTKVKGYARNDQKKMMFTICSKASQPTGMILQEI